MSTMRNFAPRRNHKERAQPLERQKWGILEKHKDYSLRAADYNAKKARLAALRAKAASRNPDEFSFSMLRSSTDSAGRKITDRGNKSLSTEAVKLLKTQDAAYLRTMAQKTRRERERVERGFVLGEVAADGGGAKMLGRDAKAAEPRKVLFVETKEEQLLVGADDSITPDIPPACDSDAYDSSSALAPPPQPPPSADQKAARKQHQRAQSSRRAKLEALRQRERALVAAEQALEMQRAKMSGSVGGVTRAGLKWKVRERKR